MNAAFFNNLSRTAWNGSTRRGFLGALAVASGLAGIDIPEGLAAKNKDEDRKRTKLKRNGFGCVNVGGACRGRDSVCCSDICDGKKPEKGEKDKSTCVAHHKGACTAEHRACSGNAQPQCNPDHPQAKCFRTTGQAGFCGMDVIPGCIQCRKDADCLTQTGEGSARVACSACPDGKGMCVPPGIG